MSYPIYYVEENDTLPILFDTFDGGTGASITMSGLAATDIEIYKDGSTTQRSSDAGYTLLDTDGIDFDSLTGIHGFSIDLSNNTDSGFYSVGSWYHVVVSSITVDSQTVSFVAAAFRIVSATRGMAGTALPNAAADAAGGLPISDAGGLDMDSIKSDTAAILVDTGTTLDGKIDTIDSNVDAILVDTADMQPKLGTISDLGSGSTIGANLADIEAQTDDIGAAGAGLTAVPWNSAWDAEVQSEVTDALNAYDPPTKAELDSGFAALNDLSAAEVNSEVDTALSDIGLDHLVSASVTGTDITDDSIIAQLVSSSATADWDDYDNTTDSLQANRDWIGDGTNLTEAGGTGDQLTAVVWNAAWDAEVQSEVTDALNAYDPPTKAELDSGFAALNDLSAADVNAEVDTALADIHLDHLLAADYDPASKPGTATALLNELVESDGGVSRFTANALEQGPGGSSSLPSLLQNTTIATLASQTSFTLTAGSADDDAYNNQIIIVTDQSTSTQKAVGIIQDYTGSTKTVTLDSDPGIFTMAVGDTVDIIATSPAASAPSAAAIRSEIDSNSTQLAAIVADTNELQTDWADGGRLDLILDARASQTSVDTVDSNVDAILVDTGTTIPAQISGLNDLDAAGVRTAVGLASANLDTQLNALPTAAENRTEMDSNSTQLAAIVADTNELQTDWVNGGRLDLILDELTTQGDTNEGKIDTLDTVADGIKAVTDNLPDSGALTTIDANVDAVLVDTGTAIPAQITALNDLSAADVNAEVVDVLRTDTIPDSVSTDGNQPTIAQAVYMMLQFLTEKAVSGTTVTVKKPDGSTSLMTFTLDDGSSPTSITRAS